MDHKLYEEESLSRCSVGSNLEDGMEQLKDRARRLAKLGDLRVAEIKLRRTHPGPLRERHRRIVPQGRKIAAVPNQQKQDGGPTSMAVAINHASYLPGSICSSVCPVRFSHFIQLVTFACLLGSSDPRVSNVSTGGSRETNEKQTKWRAHVLAGCPRSARPRPPPSTPRHIPWRPLAVGEGNERLL